MDNGIDSAAPGPTGLLDLSIGLSSPQIFSGTDFALYLHVKNPFDRPVYIEEVRTNLPASVQWKKEEIEAKEQQAPLARRRFGRLRKDPLRPMIDRLEEIHRRLALLDDAGDTDEATRKRAELRNEADELMAHLSRNKELALAYEGYDVVSLGTGSRVHIEEFRTQRPAVLTSRNSELVMTMASSDRFVPLVGALPAGTALQPGNEHAWTITLSTTNTIFFLPAAYRLNMIVLYSFTPPAAPDDAQAREIFSNTTTATVTIRTSLWAVIAGAAIGGFLGSVARTFQQLQDRVANLIWSSASASIALSVILSVAAVVFAARKSETQSFVTVEDFWGGALVGFLVGYSGVAAFEKLTGSSAPA